MMGAKNIFYRYGIMVMIPIVFAVSKVSRTQFAGIICAELILLFLNNYSVYKTHIKGEQSPKKQMKTIMVGIVVSLGVLGLSVWHLIKCVR